MASATLSALLQGLGLGAGLFLYPGPKDVIMLRMAAGGHHPLGLIALGALSDALLIAAGLAGLSALLLQAPALRQALLWLGLGVTLGLGLRAARAAFQGPPAQLGLVPSSVAPAARAAWGALLVAALLNPIAWLDTVIVLGAVGMGLALQQRVAFALGAVLASCGWFTVLVAGARGARPWMHSPATWRLVDATVALALLALAGALLARLL